MLVGGVRSEKQNAVTGSSTITLEMEREFGLDYGLFVTPVEKTQE